MTQEDAEAAILAAELTFGTLDLVPSDTVPQGDVISQNPVGGTIVDDGSPVDLVVSTGPRSPIIDEFESDIGPSGGPIFPTDPDTLGTETDVNQFTGAQYEQALGIAIISAGVEAGGVELVYDATDASIDPNFGLMNVDLTGASEFGSFEIDVVSLTGSADVEIRVYSGQELANHMVGGVTNISEAGVVEVPFSSFTSEGTGAQFEDVSQVDFVFDIDADGSIELESLMVPEPTSGLMTVAALGALSALAVRRSAGARRRG